MSKDPMGDRGKAEENRWAREQDAKAIEKLKKAGTTGEAAPSEKKPCGCKKAGENKVEGKGCPCGRCGS